MSVFAFVRNADILTFCFMTDKKMLLVVAVALVDADGRVLSGVHSTQHLLPREFFGHSLMEALAAGQLFTPPIRRLG